MSKATKTKKAVSLEVFIFLAVIIAFFGLIGAKMGGVNMMQTMMNTAYQLLLETVLYHGDCGYSRSRIWVIFRIWFDCINQ